MDPAVTVAKNTKGGFDTTKVSATSTFTSGRLNPGFSKKVDAVQLNGFIKAGGLELFGTYEVAQGRTKTEADTRKVNQLAGDLVYRFGNAENLFIGARYNTVKAELAGIANDVTINRTALAGGWFLTKNVLLKAEYVIQKYKDFPTTDLRNGGKFNGYVVEAVVGF
jgi:predicted porin